MMSKFARPSGATGWLRALVALALATVLSACGGGGGSDAPSATVTVDQAVVALADSYEDATPAPQVVTARVSGQGIAGVGLAHDPAYPTEGWVGAQITGTGPSYQVSIGVASQPSPGAHTAHLLFGAVDANGNVLDTTPITVNYRVVARLRTDTGTLAFEGVNGAAAPATARFYVIGEDLDWTVSSPDAWIRIGTPSGTGSTQIDVDVDDTGLASGTHEGSLVIASSDGQTVTVPVSFTLTSTALSVSTTHLHFGGQTGRDASTQDLQLSLGTQGNAYAWTLQSVPAWLTPSATSGMVSSTPQDIRFTPDLSLAAGQYSATLVFVAQVNGDEVRQQVDATLQVDGHRLQVSEDGVAFSATPSWSRLTRTLRVSENFGRAVAWTATSDTPWLTVTSGGVGGGNLVLSANPAALASDSLSIATVTIRSTDARVASASVRVGLWKGAGTPAAVVTRTGVDYIRIVNDPVRPYVYAHAGNTSIDVYHAYTGTKVATVAGVGNALREMAVGTDGRHLYVVDEGFKRIAVIDLSTFTKTRTITTSGPTVAGYTLVATRVSGVEILLGGDGTAYRASDGALVSAWTGMRYHMTASRDGSRFYYINWGLSPASAGGYTADYTAAGSGTLITQAIEGHSMDVGSDGDDIAVSPDGATLYTSSATSNSGSPYVFKTFDARTLAAIGNLPPVTIWPTSVETASDGRVAGGVRGTYEDYDICLYSKAGGLLRRFKIAGYAQTLAGQNLVFSGDALMLVATTTDPKLVFIPVGP